LHRSRDPAVLAVGNGFWLRLDESWRSASGWRVAMKRITFLTLLLLGFGGCNWKSNNNSPLSIAEINNRQVIGNLGIPLAETARIRATIVDGDSLRMKAFASSYVLKVSSVNGIPFAGDHLFRFDVSSQNEDDDVFGLVSGSWGFSELPNRTNGDRYTAEKINQLRSNYAGTKLLINAYEKGAFYSDGGDRHYLDTELIVLSAVEDASQ
jgi:hypothetical protein